MWSPLRMFHLEDCGEIYYEETRIMGLSSSEEHDRSLSHFHTIPACDRQADRRTDGRIEICILSYTLTHILRRNW